MSVVYMEQTDHTNNIKGSVVWQYTETVSNGNGNTIIIPDSCGVLDTILVALVANSGSGKIQTTISSLAEVIAGAANWIDWDAGVVSSNYTDAFYFVTAVRLVRSTGSPKIEVRAY